MALDAQEDVFIADNVGAHPPPGCIVEGVPVHTGRLRLPTPDPRIRPRAPAIGGCGGIAVDGRDTVLVTDSWRGEIVAIDVKSGHRRVIVGGGRPGHLGDGGPALRASLFDPEGLAVDTTGDIFVTDDGNNRIREVTVRRVIRTVAGDGFEAFAGDGGRATLASLNAPRGVAVDRHGNLYIADTGDGRVCEVTKSDGVIRTIAGGGNCAVGRCGARQPGSWVEFGAGGVQDVALGPGGALFVASATRILRMAPPSGSLAVLAGSGRVVATPGERRQQLVILPAAKAEIDPVGIAPDRCGDALVADRPEGLVRAVGRRPGRCV